MRKRLLWLRELKPAHLLWAFTTLMLMRAIYVVGQPAEQQVTLMPDGASSYFTLARNFADLGQWTSDGGISHTTGFHLLNAYVFTDLAWAGIHRLSEVSVLINTLAGITSCWILLNLTQRHLGRIAALSSALALTCQARHHQMSE